MKTFTILSMTGALAFAAVAPAFADDSATTTTPSASQQCKTERAGMGTAAFALLHGTNANKSNAFGKCVSKRSAKTEDAAKAAKTNASKDCTAEEAADMSPDHAAFRAKYGTGKNGSNAHGKCVSSKAKAKEAKEVKAEVKDEVNAAKSCKAEGKTTHKAFGKCVSTKAKAKADAREEQEQESTTTTQS
jgi:hypothetical protein